MAKKRPLFDRNKEEHIRQHQWARSPAYLDLRCPAKCLLEEFQWLYKPGRNGKLALSVRKAQQLLHVSEKTASDAFRELAAHGFIELMTGELWQERKAREWRLTFEPMGDREPTDDWQRWRPGGSVFRVPEKKSPPAKMGAACPKSGGSLPHFGGQRTEGDDRERKTENEKTTVYDGDEQHPCPQF